MYRPLQAYRVRRVLVYIKLWSLEKLKPIKSFHFSGDNATAEGNHATVEKNKPN